MFTKLDKPNKWEANGDEYYGKMSLDTMISLHQLLKDGGVMLFDKNIGLEAKVFCTFFRNVEEWEIEKDEYVVGYSNVKAHYKGVQFHCNMTNDMIAGFKEGLKNVGKSLLDSQQ